jgi:hypothetical protein
MPRALGFYLDHGRVHRSVISQEIHRRMLFSAGFPTRAVDSTRSLHRPDPRARSLTLNRRARDHPSPAVCPRPGTDVRLGDGNRASVGDMIITRANDRRLRLSATDWVKNGDRWTITHVDRSGALTVRHSRSQLTVRLPSDYVTTSTGLGYATTIHRAKASPPTPCTAC